MINKIKHLSGIGLYHDAKDVSNYTFAAATLIYAKNGLGKSTLTSVLRSLSAGDGSLIEERRTIDGTKDPRAVIEFDDKSVSSYLNGKWSKTRPEIAVFDTAFVNENVYSGNDITSEHRKNLLDFAVGDRAVAARKREEVAVIARKRATEELNALTKTLTTHSGNKSLPVFRALPELPDSETQIATLQRRLDNAERTTQITRMTAPSPFVLPELGLNELFDLLDRTLNDVHAEAEARVAVHAHSLGGPDPQRWLAQGLEYGNQETCPYCGQSTVGVDLIKMYQSHFNAAYTALKNDISRAETRLEQVLADSTATSLRKHRETVNDRLTSWSAHLPGILPLDDRLDHLTAPTLANLRELLLGLFAKKSLAPTEKLSSESDRLEAERLWQQFQNVYRDQNQIITDYTTMIEDFKKDLQGEDVEKLKTRYSEIRLAQRRHSAKVVTLFQELTDAETALASAEREKNEARAELTRVMKETLDQYRSQINANLKRLGAAFAIDQINTNYHGGTARTDYGITLRGETIQLSGGQPSFATALSDGDKRTLAFAFFAASVQSDANLNKKCVVIDDPVSSLDSARRTSTAQMLVELFKMSDQLILLAHDEHFLRSVEDMLMPSKKSADPAPISFQIKSVAELYSDFGQVSLSELCETGYYRNYRTVQDFAAGKNSEHEKAAKALRPLLEGFLHRKYPGLLPVASTLGVALTAIEKAPTGSPIEPMAAHVPALRRINDYASSFHHDTDGAHNVVSADPTEVRSFGREILDFLHAVHPA